jgi:hypothetical protein
VLRVLLVGVCLRDIFRTLWIADGLTARLRVTSDFGEARRGYGAVRFLPQKALNPKELRGWHLGDMLLIRNRNFRVARYSGFDIRSTDKDHRWVRLKF